MHLHPLGHLLHFKGKTYRLSDNLQKSVTSRAQLPAVVGNYVRCKPDASSLTNCLPGLGKTDDRAEILEDGKMQHEGRRHGNALLQGHGHQQLRRYTSKAVKNLLIRNAPLSLYGIM